MLLALGLSRLPADASEAIGIRPTLMLSPWAMAQAFRALAFVRPEIVTIMQNNAKEGTLGDLKASRALFGVATKTGTVRDPESRPLLGWIVAVTDDLIVVKTAKDRAPRQIASDLVLELKRAAHFGGQTAVSVQVFGLSFHFSIALVSFISYISNKRPTRRQP